MTAKKKGKSQENGNQKSQWTFPKNKLEDTIRLAQIIEEKNAGKPVTSDDLAKLLGYSSTSDWRYLDLLKSASSYGIVTGTGRKATVSLTQIGNDIVAPSSPAQRQKALAAAFYSVDQFKKVADFYAGKRIPDDEYFSNLVVRDFDVARDRVDAFRATFTANLLYLKAFSPNAEGQPILQIGSHEKVALRQSEESNPPADASASTGRQFLDTCFVMMPFGEWFDRYYREIYQAACREAGLEPVRADSLFHSGAVVEQIWEQIREAKVLLAELSGKNPNVFYELGLAHAASKAVVFITASLDDVPFDLRHLRVVEYDIREPNWAAKLQQNVATHLKNAKADPNKSIPQSFRDETTR